MNLFRFALLTVVATFALLMVGGTVNPAGASLACPDWPTCYGSFFPEMTGGVEFEHTHRLVATLVGLMTVILAVWIWRGAPREDRGVRWLGLLAVALVVLQGVLGGLTVLFKLPLFVSAGHLTLSVFFFSLLIYISFRLRPGRLRQGRAVPRRLVAAGAALVYAQLILGAFVRHAGAGRVCGTDWIACGAGGFWPDLGPAQLQMVHRFVGYALLLVVMVVAVVAARQARQHGRPLARRLAQAIPFIAAVQVLLGILTVHTGINVWIAMGHLGGGALLLADLFALYLALGPLGARVTERSPAELPVGALEEAS
jgi:heme A synthase